jgi:hypothetical protein
MKGNFARFCFRETVDPPGTFASNLSKSPNVRSGKIGHSTSRRMANPIKAENSADEAPGDRLPITELEFLADLAIGSPLNARLDDRVLVVADELAEMRSFDIGKEGREGAADVKRSRVHDLVKLQMATCTKWRFGRVARQKHSANGSKSKTFQVSQSLKTSE